MGQLLQLSDFRLSEKSRGTMDPRWYFTNLSYDTGSGSGWRYEVKIESDFPYRRAIHWDHFKIKVYSLRPDVRQLFVDVRRFVNRHCLGDVLFREQDMSYEYLRKVDEQYRTRRYDEWSRSGIKHGYCVFHFEEETDAALFALKFAGLVTEVVERHPDRDDIPEEQIEHAAREKFKGGPTTWW